MIVLGIGFCVLAIFFAAFGLVGFFAWGKTADGNTSENLVLMIAAVMFLLMLGFAAAADWAFHA
jgi:hypothetical protein